MKSQCKVFTGSMYGWDRKGDDMVPNWDEQSMIDYMRDLFYGYGFSGYQVAEFLDDIGETGKLGGKWRSSTVIRTMNYEFHQQREKFPKPDWWVNADFHDTRYTTRKEGFALVFWLWFGRRGSVMEPGCQ